MIKCRRRQATDPQKFKKNCQRSFCCFLLVETEAVEAKAEATGVETEAEAFEK